jgi:hypothetical protein
MHFARIQEATAPRAAPDALRFHAARESRGMRNRQRSHCRRFGSSTGIAVPRAATPPRFRAPRKSVYVEKF